MSIDVRRAAIVRWKIAINKKARLWELARTGTAADKAAAVRSDAAVDAALKEMASLYGLNWATLGANLADTGKSVDEIMTFLETISYKG